MPYSVPLMEWNNLYRWPEEPASPETPDSRSEPAKWSFKENWAYNCIAGGLHFVPHSRFVSAFVLGLLTLVLVHCFSLWLCISTMRRCVHAGLTNEIRATRVKCLVFLAPRSNNCTICSRAQNLHMSVSELCEEGVSWEESWKWTLFAVCCVFFLKRLAVYSQVPHTHTLFRTPLATTFWPYLQP